MASSNHEISIIVSAKNKIHEGLGKAKDAINSFGAGVASVFKGVVTVVGGLTAAITAVATKAVAAYSVQEQAEKRLIAAHNAMGEAGAAFIESEKAIAAQLQNETAVGDEVILSRMGQLRMLGVMPEKLEAASKGVIALTNAGMGEESAIRALAAAYQGNYSMLQKYIPTLKDCAIEAEKEQKVNDFLTASYNQQCETLNTTQGRWNELKGRIGDAWEVIGEAISKNAELNRVLQWCSEKVLAVSTAMSNWVHSGGIAHVLAVMQNFAEIINHAVRAAIIHFQEFYEKAKYYLGLPFQYVGGVIGSFVNMIAEGIKLGIAKIEEFWNRLRGRDVPPPSTAMFDAAMDVLVESAKGHTESISQAHDNLNSRLAELNKKLENEEQRHADRLAEIDENYLHKLEQIAEEAQNIPEMPQILPNEGNGGEYDVTFHMDTAQISELKDDLTEKFKTVQDEIAKSKEALSKAQSDANKSIRDLNNLDLKEAVKRTRREAKLDRDAERKAKREEKHAQELQKRLDSGGAISKNQKAWLDEYKKREQEKKKIVDNVKALQDALKAQLQEEREIKGTLQMLGKDLTALLKAG